MAMFQQNFRLWRKKTQQSVGRNGPVGQFANDRFLEGSKHYPSTDQKKRGF